MRRVLIRPALADDASALVPLYADWGHRQPASVIAERLAEWEATRYGRVLVAELDGAVAGIAGLSASPHLARPGRFARLTGLAVAERFRRRGALHPRALTGIRRRPRAPARAAALHGSARPP